MPYPLTIGFGDEAMTVVMRRFEGDKDGTFGVGNAEAGIINVVFEGYRLSGTFGVKNRMR